MAGTGEVVFEPHPYLADFAPDRFAATHDELQGCLNALVKQLDCTPVSEITPALAYGRNVIRGLSEDFKTASGSVECLMTWDRINHELNFNVGDTAHKQALEV